MGWQWGALRVTAALLQYQGAIIGVLLCLGWLWAGAMRWQELRRQQKRGRGKLLSGASGGLCALRSRETCILTATSMHLRRECRCRAAGCRRAGEGLQAADGSSGSCCGAVARRISSVACEGLQKAQPGELAVSAGHAVRRAPRIPVHCRQQGASFEAQLLLLCGNVLAVRPIFF